VAKSIYFLVDAVGRLVDQHIRIQHRLPEPEPNHHTLQPVTLAYIGELAVYDQDVVTRNLLPACNLIRCEAQAL